MGCAPSLQKNRFGTIAHTKSSCQDGPCRPKGGLGMCLYDKRLEGFVKTVELGSFAKAGEELFVSGGAVIKQVNGLERDLGVPLLDRTNHGVAPTHAGEVLYRGTIKLLSNAEALAQEVRRAGETMLRVVRLAASPMRPPTHVGRLWARASANHLNLELQIVQVSDDERGRGAIFQNLGDSVDMLLTVKPKSPHPDWESRCECRELFRSPLCIAVPLGHRLASLETVDFTDLEGESLYVQRRGSTDQIDRFIDLVVTQHPKIHLVEIAPYEMESYNAAARANAPILNCRDLGELHPAFVNVACSWGWDFALPFCLAYRRHPRPAVLEFVNAICDEAEAEAAEAR